MKEGIHPQYHQKTQVNCACGNKFYVGSTAKEINIEICSNCHPFYTGKGKLLDTQGRIERFKKILSKKEQRKETKKAKSQT